MNFESEAARKDRLLDLFLKLEGAERARMARQKASRLKYERMFRGVARVESIQQSTIRLVRENGAKIRPFEVTPEISKLLCKGDFLGLTAGLSQGIWRLICLDLIGSPGPDNQAHIAIMNPAAKEVVVQ